MSLQPQWIVPPKVTIASVSILFIIASISIYYLCQYWNYRSVTYVSKRYPFIIKVIVIFIILTICLDLAPAIILNSIHKEDSLYFCLWHFTLFTQPLCVFGIFYSILWRGWMFYYDSMINILLSSQWKTIIDPAFQDRNDRDNWLINHKKSFGSHRFIGKRILFMYTFHCLFSITLWLIMEHISYHVVFGADVLALCR